MTVVVRWTPALDDALRALHAAGRSDRAVARALGLRPWHAAQRRRRLGLPGVVDSSFRWTPALDDTLRRLNAAGMGSPRAARELGCSTICVVHRRRRLGLPPRANVPRPENFKHRHVEALRAAGWVWPNPAAPDISARDFRALLAMLGGAATLAEIAAALGLPPGTKELSRVGGRFGGQSGLAGLAARGLAVKLCSARPDGGTRPPTWVITPPALDLIQAAAQEAS